MSKTPRKKPGDLPDDFTGLGPNEARELAEVADLLRSDQPQPSDSFMQSLHQRIMNEVAVTPVAGRQAETPRQSWWSRMASALFTGTMRPALAATGAVALVALVTWAMLDRPSGTPLGPETPKPQAMDMPLAAVPTIDVPDELLQDGFLSHTPYSADDWEDDLATDDAWVWYAEDDLDSEDDYSYGLGTYWGLDDLTNDELLALEEMFEG